MARPFSLAYKAHARTCSQPHAHHVRARGRASLRLWQWQNRITDSGHKIVCYFRERSQAHRLALLAIAPGNEISQTRPVESWFQRSTPFCAQTFDSRSMLFVKCMPIQPRETDSVTTRAQFKITEWHTARAVISSQTDPHQARESSPSH
jgi:hypothetical protein